MKNEDDNQSSTGTRIKATSMEKMEIKITKAGRLLSLLAALSLLDMILTVVVGLGTHKKSLVAFTAIVLIFSYLWTFISILQFSIATLLLG